MSRVRFHIWMIMAVIAAIALLMVPLRIMLTADPVALFHIVAVAIVISLLWIAYFTPFIVSAIALRKRMGTFSINRERATFSTRRPGRSPGRAQSGEAEKV